MSDDVKLLGLLGGTIFLFSTHFLWMRAHHKLKSSLIIWLCLLFVLGSGFTVLYVKDAKSRALQAKAEAERRETNARASREREQMNKLFGDLTEIDVHAKAADVRYPVTAVEGDVMILRRPYPNMDELHTALGRLPDQEASGPDCSYMDRMFEKLHYSHSKFLHWIIPASGQVSKVFQGDQLTLKFCEERPGQFYLAELQRSNIQGYDKVGRFASEWSHSGH